MNDDTVQWITAADAAKVLRVSQRQVHRYGEARQLVTRRAGRRTLFSAASVAQLADDLAVDIRPATQTRELMTPELARYLAEQAELMRQQGETHVRIDRRLAAIEQRLNTPPAAQLPRVVIYLLAALVLLVAVGLVLIFMRVP